MHSVVKPLCRNLEIILRENPRGISEYELISKLKAQGLFSHEPEVGGHLQLFRVHFLLFHCLYLLDQELTCQKKGRLEISVLKIRLDDTMAQSTDLGFHDPLRDYYLDISNLHDTSAEEVESLLGKFWDTFSRLEGRQAALEVLGLVDPVDNVEITECYRRLAATHHPDRGGNKSRLQEINFAYRQLIQKSTSS
ncbi:MAG: DnaJ domain-containing protein [Gammaproteobacteria bacterium]|nr:DnaJ domain-containing protein [Gammaproteobacteria bacterium]